MRRSIFASPAPTHLLPGRRPYGALVLALALALPAALGTAFAQPAGVPAERAAATATGTATTTAQATARAGLEAYFSLWSAGAGDHAAPDLSVLSPKLVLRHDHSAPGLRGEVHGRDAAIEQTRAQARLARQWTFTEVRLFPTLHRDIYFAQATASGIAVNGGATIERTIVLRLELDRQQVVRLVEFTNPAAGLSVARAD